MVEVRALTKQELDEYAAEYYRQNPNAPRSYAEAYYRLYPGAPRTREGNLVWLIPRR